MDTVDLLARQTEDSYRWIQELLGSVPYDRWDIMPDIVESTLSWQTGHLVISLYFHTMMSIRGHQMDIMEQIPIKEYAELFNAAHPSHSRGKYPPEELHAHLRLMGQKSVDIIRSLTPEELEHPLEPMRRNHPVARTKFEALDWNIKHTMWHGGQIGILKRVVHERYDFGL